MNVRAISAEDKERHDDLIHWAAQEMLARKIATIADFAQAPILVLETDGRRVEASLAGLAIDPKTAAILFRDAYGALARRHADARKDIARRRWGLTEPEFGQALKDYEALVAWRNRLSG